MKTGTLVTGIVLMIIAAIGFFSMQQTISDCGSFTGQLGRFFSSDISQQCQMAQIIQLGSVIFGIIGLGLVIGGAVAKGGEQKITRWKNPQKYLKEEYNAGYEESRSSNKPTIEKDDNIKNLGILKERLAKGEISKEEYDELKKEFE